MNKRDLKIEVRAVIHVEGLSNRVLEYRISPDQDVSYEIDAEGWWQRLEKRLFPKKYVGCYGTYWVRPHVFANYTLAYLYDEDNDLNWIPIWIKDKKEFEHYKNKFKTYGDLKDWMDEWNETNIAVWKKRREEYLGESQDWY